MLEVPNEAGFEEEVKVQRRANHRIKLNPTLPARNWRVILHNYRYVKGVKGVKVLFCNLLQVLSKFRHPNLVSLMGRCLGRSDTCDIEVI